MKFLYQKPEKGARNQQGAIYHWTPALEKKSGMREITEEQAKRIRKGEDPSIVLAPTDSEGKLELPPNCTMMAVPNKLANAVRSLIQDGETPEVVTAAVTVDSVDETTAADKEFGIPAPAEPDEPEPPNLRPVEVVKIERARSVNTVESLNAELPEEYRATLDRASMDLPDMKALVVKGYEAKILAEAEK